MSGAALIMIGAGEAQDLPADWPHTYDRLIVIEPIPELAADLRDRFSGMNPVETIEAAIVGDADGAEATTLQVFSWQAVSSRYAPAELLNLFPGLEVDRALRVRAVTLSQLLETCQLEADADNGLMIDAPGEGLPIVQSLIEGEWREAFTRLSVREPAQGLYDTTSGPDPIVDALKAAGFSQDATDTQDPEWPSLTFSRNRWKLRSERLSGDVERLTAELAERDQQVIELEQQLQESFAARDEETTAHRVKYEEVYAWFSARKKQALELAEKAERLQHSLGQAQDTVEKQLATINKLEDQLAEQANVGTTVSEQLATLDTRLESLFSEQKAYIRETTNAIGQHVTRMGREQMDNAAIRDYLGPLARFPETDLPFGFQRGLLGRFCQNQYDLVLVFGSYDSAELLSCAVLLEKKNRESNAITSASRPSSHPDDVVVPSRSDIPRWITAFEHQRSACADLVQKLSERGLDAPCSVSFAPWLEYRDSETDGLFYACCDDLTRVRQWLAPDALVLVVIGRELVDTKDGRSAALPYLLQHLPTHRLDIIALGDGYENESSLKTDWSHLLESRGRAFSNIEIPNGFGVRING